MKIFRTLAVACVPILSLISSPALALANRVFVSARSGNNANSCDNINTPCQTFAGAVTQLNPGGELIVLDSGGYGAVTITQSLTIEAPPGVVAFVHPASGHAITVNAGASDTVVLRGLVLNGGSGNGIQVNTVGTLFVESCVISGFSGADATHGSGIIFVSAGNLFVKDTIVRANGYGAIGIAPASGTAKASIDRCRLEANTFGLYVLPFVVATVRDSVASGHAGPGFGADQVPGAGTGGGELNIENCLSANNLIGIVSYPFALVRVSNTTVTDNTTGLFTESPGSLLSRGNNTVEGNTTNGSFTGTYSSK